MSCAYRGAPDLYGLGIRVAFYLLWFGHIAASWVVRSEVPVLRFVAALFSAGGFLALVIRTSTDSIRPIDVYIGLLLAYGPFYTYVPVYLWRLLIACNPFWDPSRWPRVGETVIYGRLLLLLGIAITCFQMWFWASGINTLPRGEEDPTCETWGFFFTKAPLHSALFVAANIVFTIFLLICFVIVFSVDLGVAKRPRWIAKQEKRFEKAMKRLDQREEEYAWKGSLQFIKTMLDLAVLSSVVVAIELTIQWNSLVDVNWVTTTSQTLPLVLGAGLVAHIGFVWVHPFHLLEILDDISADMPEVEGTESSSSSGGSRREGG